MIGTPLSPSATRVMMLGSGELGKEVTIALQRLGVEVVAVDRYDGAPAHQVAHRAHTIDMTDADEGSTDAVRRIGRIGVAVVAFGILGDQARAEADPSHAVQIAQTDYVAQVSILLGLAKLLRAQDQHHAIIDAIKRREGSRVEALVREHAGRAPSDREA